MNLSAFLLLLVFTTALAASELTSPLLHRDNSVNPLLSRFTPKEQEEATKKELAFLDAFNRPTLLPRVETEFVSIFRAKHSDRVSEDSVRHALKVAREVVRERFYHNRITQYLRSEIEPHSLQEDLEEIYSEAFQRVTGEPLNRWQINYLYEDDWSMNLLFTLILAQGDAAYPEGVASEPGSYLHRSYMRVGTKLKSGPHSQADVDYLTRLGLGDEIYNVYKIVQQVRQEFTRDGSDLPVRQIDSLMIPKLRLLLPTKYTNFKIEAMRQARHAITLQRAVSFKKLWAIRYLTASGIKTPSRYFLKHVAYPTFYDDSADMLKLVLQDPTFTIDIFLPIFSLAVNECNMDKPQIPFLLNDRFATSKVIKNMLDDSYPKAPKYYMRCLSNIQKVQPQKAKEVIQLIDEENRAKQVERMKNLANEENRAKEAKMKEDRTKLAERMKKFNEERPAAEANKMEDPAKEVERMKNLANEENRANEAKMKEYRAKLAERMKKYNEERRAAEANEMEDPAKKVEGVEKLAKETEVKVKKPAEKNQNVDAVDKVERIFIGFGVLAIMYALAFGVYKLFVM